LDIRFLAWAGYDLSGKQHYYSIDWPDMDSDEVGHKKIKAKEIKSAISAVEELQPSIRYKRHDMRPSVSGHELKPFPKPIET
jgi:hypothetical protein